MGLPPWETSGSQFFALLTGTNSGLGYSIAARMVEDFLTAPATPSDKHLILILCTRSPLKTRLTISRLRASLRVLLESSSFSKRQIAIAKAQGKEYKWEDWARRVTFLGAEVDLTNLQSVFALTDRLVNGTVGSPDATTAEGGRLPHGSPGTASYSTEAVQDTWALSQVPGSTGTKRSWGWGLSGLKIPRLDAVICTAGIGGWRGLNWGAAVYRTMTNLIEEVTWPTYKLATVGATVKSQTGNRKAASSGDTVQSLQSSPREEPPLGNVFCANVFGHYLLAHGLMPLLSKPASPSSRNGGKIILTSSLEPLSHHFDFDDFQGLSSLTPYESSKRIIDILALTSELPSVKKVSGPFFDPSDVSVRKPEDDEDEIEDSHLVKPTMHVVHPGIFVSEILEFNFFIATLFTWIAYVARWLGSPWHAIVPEKAAVASAWVALLDPDGLAKIEENGAAKYKWGSSTDTSGDERVMRTEVPGWGWNGKPDGNPNGGRHGRRRDAVDLTPEAREEFEILGSKVWGEMENLRKEWEELLGVGVDKK